MCAVSYTHLDVYKRQYVHRERSTSGSEEKWSIMYKTKCVLKTGYTGLNSRFPQRDTEDTTSPKSTLHIRALIYIYNVNNKNPKES